ncbi:charged multivesicular body protein 6 [Angomonas deanei]|nr:charged multivesicular body protein 6 [Angomonas deanei]|eukprot:EPY30608.1 charged multivesicular body protein 6 [Angomonas deanei]
MGSSGSKSDTKKNDRREPAPKPVERSTITASDKAKLQLKLQRDNLTAAIKRFERVEEKEHEKAKEFMRAGNKRKALYCLKREKAQRSQIDSVTSILDNVENLIATVEFAQIEAEVVNAMKDGKSELEKLNKMLNIDDVEKLMDETAESVEEARRIDAILSMPIDGVENDDELLNELREQMGEVKEESNVDTVKVPNHALPEVQKEEEKSPEKEKRQLAAA